MFTWNKRASIYKPKLIQLQEDIEKSIFIVKDFNLYLLLIDQAAKITFKWEEEEIEIFKDPKFSSHKHLLKY